MLVIVFTMIKRSIISGASSPSISARGFFPSTRDEHIHPPRPAHSGLSSFRIILSIDQYPVVHRTRRPPPLSSDVFVVVVVVLPWINLLQPDHISVHPTLPPSTAGDLSRPQERPPNNTSTSRSPHSPDKNTPRIHYSQTFLTALPPALSRIPRRSRTSPPCPSPTSP